MLIQNHNIYIKHHAQPRIVRRFALISKLCVLAPKNDPRYNRFSESHIKLKIAPLDRPVSGAAIATYDTDGLNPLTKFIFEVKDDKGGNVTHEAVPALKIDQAEGKTQESLVNIIYFDNPLMPVSDDNGAKEYEITRTEWDLDGLVELGDRTIGCETFSIKNSRQENFEMACLVLEIPEEFPEFEVKELSDRSFREMTQEEMIDLTSSSVGFRSVGWCAENLPRNESFKLLLTTKF